MTWTAEGSIFQVAGSIPGTNTIALNNQVAGDLLVLITLTISATGYVSGVSGGGATWVQAGSVFHGTTQADSATVWLGKVTATGSQTATFTYTGSPSYILADGFEFASSVGSWAADGSPGFLDSADTNTMPSLTPAGSGDLYVGFSGCSSAATAGSTSGYTYIVDAGSDAFCYNTNCTSAAQAPVWGNSVLVFGAAVLVREPVSYHAAVRPARAQLPRIPLRGVYMGPAPKDTSFGTGQVQWNAGGPVRNPQAGPAFRQAVTPSRARITPPRRGRVSSSPGTPQKLPPTPAAAAPGRGGPVQAKLPPPRRGTCRAIKFLPVQGNPQAGPAFPAAVQPVRARITQPPRGRTAGNPGTSVIKPVVTGPRVYPLPGPVKAKLPQQPFLRGRAYSHPGAPLRNPNAGPAFRSAVTPARTRITLPARGRIGSSPGSPVQVPPPVVTAVPRQGRSVQAKLPLPRRGRVYSHPGAPLRNPQVGPVFRQAVTPARVRPSLPPRGRIGSNPGGPLENPIPPIEAVFFQKAFPIRARIPQVAPRGRVYSHPGAPVRNPNPGPVFHQAVRPGQARFPLPPRGRIASNPGGPVRNPVVPAPAYPLHSPVQARFPLPPRGRIASNPGTLPPLPPVPAKVYPAQGPVRIRITLPPRGRTAGNPGAPVRNPHPGPVFIAAIRPIRAVIPQNAPRGRAAGNPGGPVANIPFATLKFRVGTPYLQWATGDPRFRWATGDPEAG